MFASKSTGGFYSLDIHPEMPTDVVELPPGYYAELMSGLLPGKVLDWSSGSLPVLANAADLPAPILTREQIENLRLGAYADPLSGSDRYFAEALRMQAMGESGWEEQRALGVARFEAIQAFYPWPPEVATNSA